MTDCDQSASARSIISSARRFIDVPIRSATRRSSSLVRSFSKRAFVRALQKLVPDLREEDVHPAGSGVRAQALAPTGQLVDDFLIVERPRALHVCNAPSPAATASLAIAGEILGRAEAAFGLGARAAEPTAAR